MKWTPESMGRKGGKNGNGKSKRRSPEHYRFMASQRAFFKKIKGMPIDEVCKKYNVQACHICLNFDCGDNMNKRKKA